MLPKHHDMWLMMVALHDLAEERHPGQTPCDTPYMPDQTPSGKYGYGYYCNSVDGSTHLINERMLVADGRFAHIYKQGVINDT